MPWFRKLERVLTLHDSTEKALKRRSFADQCVKFRTRSGRLAHWVHADYGVLCGQHGADFEAEPGLEDCRLCKARLAELAGEQSGQAAAS